MIAARDGQLTPTAVSKNLAEVSRQLDAAVLTLKQAELDAARLRHEADLAESHAYVAADGPVEERKHRARIASAQAEDAALVAEATLRWLRARIRALDTRVEVGRTMAATVRMELKMLPDPEAP